MKFHRGSWNRRCLSRSTTISASILGSWCLFAIDLWTPSGDVVPEDFPEESRHDTIDEEVDGRVHHHQQLRDRAREKDPERQMNASVGDILFVLLDGEDLKEELGSISSDILHTNNRDRKRKKPPRLFSDTFLKTGKNSNEFLLKFEQFHVQLIF